MPVLRSRFVRVIVFLGAALDWGCASSPAGDFAPSSPVDEPTEAAAPERGTEPASAAQTLDTLESALQTGSYRVELGMHAEGAVRVAMRGELTVDEQRVVLRATGTFGGQPATVELIADGERMKGTGPGGTFDLPEPEGLREAIAIGWTRMGLLHNIALLVAGRPPDHAEGGVGQWVVVHDLQRSRTVTELEPATASLPDDPISMQIEVSGQRAGRATLWLDPRTRMPLERHQIVDFDEGQMRVRETYAWGDG